MCFGTTPPYQFSSDITFWRHAEGSLKQGCLVDLVIAPTVWLLSRDHSGLLKLTRFDKHGKRRSNPGEEEELDEKVRKVWAAVTPCGKIKPELASTNQRPNFLDLSNVTTPRQITGHSPMHCKKTQNIGFNFVRYYRPPLAIPHPITIQNMRFDWMKIIVALPL